MGESEISIADVFKIFSKHKFWIIILPIVFAVFAYFICILMPQKYSISTYISPGKVSPEKKLENRQNIAAFIQSSNFKIMLKNRLDNKHEELSLDYNVELPKNTDLIGINILSEDSEKGKVILATANELLNDHYEKIANYYRKRIDSTINDLIDKREMVKGTIILVKNNLDLLKENEKNLSNLLAQVQGNTDKLLNQRDQLLKSHINENEQMTMLLVSNTIQQNIAYINSLLSNLSQVKQKIQEADNKLSDLKIQLGKIERDINDEKFNKEYITSLEIISPPDSSDQPVFPNKPLISAGVFILTLFMTIFVIIIRESIVRENLSSSE